MTPCLSILLKKQQTSFDYQNTSRYYMIDLVCVQFKVGICALPTKGLVIRVQPNFVILKKKHHTCIHQS